MLGDLRIFVRLVGIHSASASSGFFRLYSRTAFLGVGFHAVEPAAYRAEAFADDKPVGYLAHYVGIERVGVRIHPVGSRLAGMYPKGNCFPGY